MQSVAVPGEHCAHVHQPAGVVGALFGRSSRKQKQTDEACGLALFDKRRPPNSTSAGLGPMAAMQSVDARGLSAGEKLAWLEESRMDAILGASSRSHKSVRSGIRCWVAFVGTCSAIVHSTQLWLRVFGQTDMTQ